MARVANPLSLVEYGNMRFLISDAPTDKNIEAYIREFSRYKVTDVVRACEPTYSPDRIKRSGIEVHEMPFPDGDPPPEDIITAWLDLCDRRFGKAKSSGAARGGGAGGSSEDDRPPVIAVHCVAGLGRAPVLVAISLIEAGMEPDSAVQYVRNSRTNAFNRRQLNYLMDEYRKRRGRRCCIQ